MMGPSGLLLLAAAGGAGLAACAPVSTILCNGFPTGKAATVNSSPTKFRLDETGGLQAAGSPREGQQLWSLAALYGRVGRLERSSSALPDLIELHVAKRFASSSQPTNWSNWSTMVNLGNATVT